MRLTLFKLLAFTAVFNFISESSQAQGYSFNCARDTILPGCPPNLCFTLEALIPDPQRAATTYAVNSPTILPSCLLSQGNPGVPGQPTQLDLDDTYSDVFSIGFPFIFFGTPYNDLVVSSNGYISFNTALTGQFSQWNMINGGNGQDLPSTFYDEALIMGPMHDIDVRIATSPSRLISYQTSGIAPYRTWTITYYKIPLFSVACNNLIENTHQITLYESTGIIDVNIFDKQICTGWNQGRAMVGVQNFAQNTGVMAPGRRASDAPWGAVGMNERWRFVPTGGIPLFRRVELYDLAGNLVSTGTTVQLPNGDRKASFPNICPPPGSSTPYVIKAFYDKIDNPAIEIFGLDTVVVNRQQGLAASATTSSATCGNSNGVITVNNTSGGNGTYEYSLDGITWQTSNVFTGVPGGTHTVYIRDAGGVCTAQYPVTVGVISNLTATTTNTATACTGVNNGSITVTSSAGSPPFTFSLDGGTFVAGTIPFTFSNLSPGNHTVVVKDVNNCTTNTITVNITTGTGVTATSAQTPATCAGVNNGVITVTTTAGTAPFEFSINGGTTWQSSNVFTGLAPGSYTIIVRDAAGCTRTLTRTVTAGSSLATNFSQSGTSCSGASDGTATVTPVSGTAPYTFVLDGTTTVTGTTATFNNLSAGSHTITVTDANGCVRNPSHTFTIAAGPALVTTATASNVQCNGGATGSITVTQPTIGIPPYEYSLDGVTWQTSNVFNGLVAGTYTVYYREGNGCNGQLTRTISEPAILNATSSTTAAVCNGQSNGIITVTSPTGGTAPYEYSIDGTNWQSSSTFNVAAGTYTVTIRDANGCTFPQTVTVTEPNALTATATTTNATCNGGNDGTITVTANGGNTSYEYALGAASFQTSNVFNVAPGTYDVTVKDNFGCSYTVTGIVVGLTNDLTFTQPVDPTICEGSSTQLNIVSNALQYSWSPATALSNPNVANPTANPTATTNYTVTLTYGRCTADVPVIVNVNAAPIPDAGAKGFICYGQSYTLQGSGGTQYSWTPSTYLNNPNIANPVATPDRTIVYTVSILQDANGCPSLTTDTVTVDVTPPIYVTTFPYDTIAHEGDQFQILATSVATDYLWTPSIGLSDPTIPNPIVTAGAVGDVVVYKVTASTQAGCKGEGYVRVQVYKGPDLYVPTGFTPNGDGVNDSFFPFPVGIKEIKYFRVFNRWGQLIFSTNRLNDGWDGKLSGKEQASGVYVWLAQGVTADGRIITKKGTVTLIR
jgi:gliding motility-associated-like protein